MAEDCSGCGPDVYKGTTNWGEQINCLRCEIKSLNAEIQQSSRHAETFTTKLGSTWNVMKGMLQTINSMKKDMKDFTTSSQRQYDLGEKIAEEYKKTAINIGLSVGKTKDFNKEFKGSVAEIAKFGGKIEDASTIYEEFANSSGRVRILGKDEVSNIFKLHKAAGLVGTEATNLYEAFDLMGVSNVDATERMEELIKDSQSIGLNSSKVVKTLSSNMNKMQSYSFANGVKGMTDMAKLAVKMRMDVGEMLGMSDKFYNPEGAIEAAANLQMLGGDIAKAFGDPLQLMYEARNAPEELGKRVSTMVENMMTLNKETGEYEFPPDVRMTLKAAGDQLGINIDSMIEMTRQSNKIKDVKDQLSTKNMFSDEEMEGIASMARMEGGEFKVDIRNEEGDKITKSIDELTSGDVELLMRAPKNEEDYMSKMVDNSFTTNEYLKNINDSFQKGMINEVDLYEIYEKSSKLTLEATRDMATKSVKESADILTDTIAGAIGGWGQGKLESIDKQMAAAISSLTSFIEGNKEFEVVGEAITINTSATNINLSDGKSGGKTTEANLSGQIKCEENGGEFRDGKCYKKNSNELLPLAKGGIVTKPINALIGEGEDTAAAFPLSNIERFLESQKVGSFNLGGTANINLNITSDNPNLSYSTEDSRKLKESILKTVTAMFNNGGSPDGANTPQPSRGFGQLI